MIETPIRLVVVDDSADLRLMFSVLFGSDPRFEVVGEAGDGQAALDVIARTRPDVVLLDVEMPVKNGFEVLDELAGMPADPLVIVLSGMTHLVSAEQAISRGADAYFTKSIEPEELLHQIEALHGGRHRAATVAPVVADPASRPFESVDQRLAFVSRARHRLGNALSTISGWAGTLERFPDLPADERRQGVDAIARSARTLTQQFEALFDLERLRIAASDADVAHIDLADLVARTVDDERIDDPSRVRSSVPPGTTVVADGPLAQEALVRILDNALVHGDVSKPVTVSSRSDGAVVRLIVADGGAGPLPGVDPFTPFRSPDRATGGVGLGLFVSRMLLASFGAGVGFDDVDGTTACVVTFLASDFGESPLVGS